MGAPRGGVDVEPLVVLLRPGDLDPDGTGPWAPPAPVTPGAVTLCEPDLAPGLARLLHADQPDLALLVVDPRRLTAAVREVDPYGLGRALHEHDGPLPREAMLAVVPFPPGPGGRWRRPELPALG